MERRFYIDTSMWIDYVEDRGDGIRPLGEFAFRFLKNCEINNCKILYSDLVLKELRRYCSDERIEQVFYHFRNSLTKAEISDSQISESEKIASETKEVHKSDILHAIVARDNNAVLVTRDEHFEYLRHIARIARPEKITFV